MRVTRVSRCQPSSQIEDQSEAPRTSGSAGEATRQKIVATEKIVTIFAIRTVLGIGTGNSSAVVSVVPSDRSSKRGALLGQKRHPKCQDRTSMAARAEVTPLEKVLLISCARRWAATATSGTRGACVVSSDQAPRRARSMGSRGSGLFNGVTQNASLLAFQRAHQRHSLLVNVTLCISSGYRDCGLPVIYS